MVLSACYLVDGTLVYELRMGHTTVRSPKRLVLVWLQTFQGSVPRCTTLCQKRFLRPGRSVNQRGLDSIPEVWHCAGQSLERILICQEHED